MKVSTELKSIIVGEFSKRKKAIEKKYEDVVREAYKKRLTELEESKEFIEFMRATRALCDSLKDDCEKHPDLYTNETPYAYGDLFYKLMKLESKQIIRSNEYRCTKSDVYFDELHENERQRDTLLIKLTYEKNMEDITKLLAEYGIEL